MIRWAVNAVILVMLLTLSACREEGPMEKAGREVDEAVEKLMHGDEGTLEKAGRKIDEALEEKEEEGSG